MKKIISIIALLATIMLYSCSSKPEAPTVPSVDTTEVEEADIVITDNIFSEKTDFVVGVSAEVYITAPKAEAPLYGENVDKFNELIDMIADTVKNEYYHDVAIGSGAEGAAATSRMLTYEVYTAKDGYISVLLKITSSIAGAINPSVAYRCVNYDLKEGKTLTLTEIVGEDKIDVVKALILDQMKETPKEYFTTDDGALDNIDISSSFLEKNGKLYIVIDEYAIAPRSKGAFIFEIDKGEIG